MRTLAVLLAAVLTATGCGRPEKVTVLAAASLTEAFEVLGRDSDVRFSFAGSQQLAAQVEAGAPVDVVATADADVMAHLGRAGLVDPPVTFARNRLAIAVAPGNPLRIQGVADLARRELKVVLADPSVPAGRYAAQALDRVGAHVKPVSLELDVKAVARKVAAGDADAGIVYATDVAPGARVDLPEADNVVATYPVAVVTATKNRRGAEAFVARLLGPPGRDALTARGFLLP